MYTPSIIIGFLTLSPLVVAHGKIAVVTGNLGGNGTALGIKGAVVADTGSNSKTELDTTVFDIGSNNCGQTEVLILLQTLYDNYQLTIQRLQGETKQSPV